MFKRLLVIILLLVIVGIIGIALLARRPAIDPVIPNKNFASELIAQGEMLAGAGYCGSCHTVAGGQPYTGGYPMETGFGTIYSTNITPDPDTGIGNWSEVAFRRAMREGVARDGSHHFPAFPYDHFTKLSDADIKALYAYFMTRKPIRAERRDNELPFPLNIRALQAGWKLLFFKEERFEPVSNKSAVFNRGAYLAEGISHCGACHTPRNLLGAEKTSKPYAGAIINKWIAPALDGSNPAPVPWSEDDLYSYLRTGLSQYHGNAGGPMAPVIRYLAKVSDEDVRALAVYFADINGTAVELDARGAAFGDVIKRSVAADRQDMNVPRNRGQMLYINACASCHYNGERDRGHERPDLALNSALSLDDPTNLIQVILYGVASDEGADGIVMPGFQTMSDDRIAEIAAYLRSTRTDKAAWKNLEAKVAAIRADGPYQK